MHFFLVSNSFFCQCVGMDSKERMKEWKKLPEGTIPWETFKRLVSQFGMDKGIEKAKKIIDKQKRKV